MSDLKKIPLIILTGPTAVGKTELSIKLAKAVNAEIISADSMQVYKYMDIGTAKILPEEMQGIKHYLVDEFDPKMDFNVTIFKDKAKAAIEEIVKNGHIPMIVGGTGFYIQAVLYDIDFTEGEDDKSYREYLYELADKEGAQRVHDMLRQVDPVSADNIHFNNVKRVVRALEYFKQTNKPISEHNEEQKEKASPYNYKYFVLNDDRDILYNRIDKRVDIMFENGLVSEVEKLKDMGLTKDDVSMQGIGYKEVFDYLEGQCSLEELKETIKRDTRHFAKRQITWFKREKDIEWLNYQDFNSDKELILEAMLDKLKKKDIL